MTEAKSKKRMPIHVELSVALVKHGYKFIGVNDLGDVDGKCQECGHSIRYEYVVKDLKTNRKNILGSDCIYKLVALENWEKQIDLIDLMNGQLLRAGKWRWILSRDGLVPHAVRIPEPRNYAKDFKRFADDMRKTVLMARKKVKMLRKQELARRVREERSKLTRTSTEQLNKRWSEFLVKHNIDNSALTTRDKEFLRSVHRKEKLGYSLSEKQRKWFDDIKKKKYIGRPESTKSIADKSGFDKIPREKFDVLSDWERKFITSIKAKIVKGEHLSDKQIEQSNKILRKIKAGKKEPGKKSTKSLTTEGSYIGKTASAWIISQKIGVWKSAIITFVHKETGKAIMCDFEVDGRTYHQKWLPKSQIK